MTVYKLGVSIIKQPKALEVLRWGLGWKRARSQRRTIKREIIEPSSASVLLPPKVAGVHFSWTSSCIDFSLHSVCKLLSTPGAKQSSAAGRGWTLHRRKTPHRIFASQGEWDYFTGYHTDNVNGIRASQVGEMQWLNINSIFLCLSKNHGTMFHLIHLSRCAAIHQPVHGCFARKCVRYHIQLASHAFQFSLIQVHPRKVFSGNSELVDELESFHLSRLHFNTPW